MKTILRVGIIGGGPAGSLFAHFAFRWSNRLNLPIKVTIFDGKNFLKKGPPGCNLCAGVISRNLQHLLQEEGIFLPSPRIMSWVDGYVLHAGEESLYLFSPEERTGQVATVFRGNGPRYALFPEIISFDDFLLSWAQDLGATIIPYPIKNIRWFKNENQPLCLQYGSEELEGEDEFDWVIGAFGVNTGLGQKLHQLGLGYLPPRTKIAFQAEFKFSPDIQEKFINHRIHIFLPRKSSIRYATLIPKGQFTTLTIIGWKDAHPKILKEFFELEDIKKHLPVMEPICFCFPRLVTGSCRWPKIPYFLIIGDAAFCRYYKNGLESAFISARLAAKAIFCSKQDERPAKIYYHQARKTIIADNFYGRLLFRLNHAVISFKPFLRLHLYLAKKEPNSISRSLRKILWDLFTGERPYRQIFQACFKPKLQLSLFLALLSGQWRKGRVKQKLSDRNNINSEDSNSQNKGSFEFLSDLSELKDSKDGLPNGANNSIDLEEPFSLTGKTIVVIGGGPAGASFGIKLLSLARKKGQNPRIVIYEGKPLDKKSHYNQCLGVLSPPLPEIMEKELGVPFPWSIIQKKILGYYLHTEGTTIRLDGTQEPSFACRRIEFDSYLFEKAQKAGVEIVNARVIDLDFLNQGVMVYSESNNLKADWVIGAFGLDDGMIKIMERLTPYRQPECLTSIVTKFHPGLEAVEAFGQYLHVFLLKSIPGIEFAAITPKGNHLSLNIAGREVNASSMDLFLSLPKVRQVLPPNSEKYLSNLSYYKGKFPTGPARHFLLDRIIMIGDAAGLNRPFKGKGINSALLTAIRAAEAFAQYGFTEKMKRKYLTLCADLISDIPYGRRLRWLTIILTRLGLMDGLFNLAPQQPALYRALFHIVSGQKAYRSIWQEEYDLRLLLKMAIAALTYRRAAQNKN